MSTRLFKAAPGLTQAVCNELVSFEELDNVEDTSSARYMGEEKYLQLQSKLGCSSLVYVSRGYDTLKGNKLLRF